jgi:SAM-dependent methyltransferase
MLNWKTELEKISINVILLLEEFHLKYIFEKYNLQEEFAIIFKNKPYIEWYIRNKATELNEIVDNIILKYKNENITDKKIKETEYKILQKLEDWIIYVLSPNDYNNQPFNNWNKKELLDIIKWDNKIVVDIGSGTGKQAFIVAPYVKSLYCVEPVYNLRKYLKKKSSTLKHNNMFVVDGYITSIPFEDNFSDITMCGHVLGDSLEQELDEMERITKNNGMIIACPGNVDKDNDQHGIFIRRGYNWKKFLEPGNVIGSGPKRKYWKNKE